MLRRLLLAALTLGALTLPASATWSIVVVNVKTGEVGLASATCIPNADLELPIGLIRVGQGAAAVQHSGDASGAVRQRIVLGFEQGATPERILEYLVALGGGVQGTQIGIASFDGPAVTFDGAGVSAPHFGLAGSQGDLRYAIQGNVITGLPVVTEAELALLSTPGDLATKLMAGMEAARLMGGDGRCSCSQSAPGSCGSPPASFTKSAHVGFVIVARMGDVDGTCGAVFGCTNGEYYLARKATQGVNGEDPVLRLANKLAVWRAGLSGVADQQLSEVHLEVPELVADGQSSTRVTLRLVDLDGVALAAGGQAVTVTPVHAGPDPALAGPVVDNGDGTFDFFVTASGDPGTARFHVRVDDGAGHDVLLWPPLEVPVAPLAEFHASHDLVGNQGAQVRLTVNAGPALAGQPYRVLASTSGTFPGAWLWGVKTPLVADVMFRTTLLTPSPPFYNGFIGTLDPGGRAEAVMDVNALAVGQLAGLRVDLCAIFGMGGGGTGPALGVTAADGFNVAPLP